MTTGVRWVLGVTSGVRWAPMSGSAHPRSGAPRARGPETGLGGGNGDAGPERCSGPASGRPSAARQRVAWYSSTIS